MAHKREQKSEQKRTLEQEQKQAQQEKNQRNEAEQKRTNEKFALMVQELSLQAGKVEGLELERDRLNVKLEKAQDRVNELERENGVLQGKLEMMEATQQAADPPISAENPPGANRTMVYIIGVLLLIVVIVLIFVAIQAFGS